MAIRIPGFPEVHRATTPTAIEAIRRFRYDVYVREFGRRFSSVDDAQQRIAEPDDGEPHVWLYHVGTPDDVRGTMRLRVFEPDRIPASIREAYDLERLPLGGLRLGELGRTMVAAEDRRGKAFVAMFAQAYQDGLAAGVDVAICSCLPGLMPYYVKLGMRPYGGRPYRGLNGLEIPLIGVSADVRHLVRIGSPLAAILLPLGVARRGADATALIAALERGPTGVTLDEDAVWAEVADALDGADRSFLGRIGSDLAGHLAASGFVLDVPAGEPLISRGTVQRELYVVLDGAFAVTQEARFLRMVGPGEVIGEIAFFGDAGTRTAAVTAAVDSQILVLKRKFVDDLVETDPRSAARLMLEISRVLADRFTARGA